MCWYGKNVKNIAEEDIKVFKFVLFAVDLNSSYYTSYFYPSCRWTLNKKKTSEIKTYKDFSGISITKGLHSYSNNCRVSKIGLLIKCFFNDNKKHFTYPYTRNVYKMNCIIPKGSTYYLNSNGEYVSDALIPILFEPV